MNQVKEAVSIRVTNVSRHGFRICIGEREVYASFRDFPWFEDASDREITTVELLSPRHLYWPELDVDLTVDSLDYPDRYPLVSRSHRGVGARHDVE